MARLSQPKEELDKLARRGAYSLVMGFGGLFAYFNDKYHWVSAPKRERLSDLWFKPIQPALEPYLPPLVLILGIGFLLFSAYCFYRYVALSKLGEQSA
jgi:hypothetical protein